MNDIQPQATAPSRADTLFQIAALEVLAAELTGRATDLRQEVGSGIREEYDADGTRCAVDVRIPGTKTTVGKVSTSITTESATVRDALAFAKWVQENHPTEIEYVPTVKETFKKHILKQVEWSTDDDGNDVAEIIDKDTGEVLETPAGLKRNVGGIYKNFAINGKDPSAIMAHLRSLDLGEVIGAADNAIEAFATVSGEVAAASDAVVAGEVVDNGEEAA